LIGRVKAANDTTTRKSEEKNVIERNGVYVITEQEVNNWISLNNLICIKMGLKPDGSMSQAFISRSDYYHFHRNGIPILGYSTGLMRITIK